LFKCAVKDDDTLVDAIVERLYFTMKDLDAARAEYAMGLIVDREATAGSKFDAAGVEYRARAIISHRPFQDRSLDLSTAF
jgi:hypothetical protein